MKYEHIKRPNFVLYGPNGEMEELFCKMCGTAIMGMNEQVKGRRMGPDGKWIEERILRFRRFHNYAELKMEFWDGSAHVTNGCRDCLHEGLTFDQMYELHVCDMEMDGTLHTKINRRRVPKGITVIRHDGGGIT